jgi:CrcB protein
MKNVLSVGMGGVLGTLARYYIYMPLNSHFFFPWGTMTVNIMGSFFLAFFLTLALRHFYHRSLLVLSISTGFTGSFTTFSSVSVEMVRMMQIHPVIALLYVMTSFSGGLILAYIGRLLGNNLSASIAKKLGEKEEGGVE